MLAQRLRRWPNIRTSLFQRVVFAGILASKVKNVVTAYLLEVEVSSYYIWL